MNFIPWINKLNKFCHTYREDDYTEEYDNLLVGLIGFSSICKASELNKLIVDPNEFSTETEKLITGVTLGIQGDYYCYMLTPEQINANKCSSKFMILDGDFGTGKTLVLKERAMAFAKAYPNDKIAYMNLTGAENYALKKDNVNMMDLMARNDFKDFMNIEVVTCKDLANHFEINPQVEEFKEHIHAAIKSYIKFKNYDHLFIDEMPTIINPLIVDNTSPFIICAYDNGDFFGTCQSFCIAIRLSQYYGKWINSIILEYKPVIIKLKQNLRNSQNILNIANNIKFNCGNSQMISAPDLSHIYPGKNITGPKCYHYKRMNNQNPDWPSVVAAALKKYFGKYPETPVVVLFSQLTFINKIKLSQAILKKSYNVTTNLEEYLTNPKGIMVTSIEDFQGAQARNTIIILDSHRIVNQDFNFYDKKYNLENYVIYNITNRLLWNWTYTNTITTRVNY